MIKKKKKPPQKVGREGTYINKMKTIQDKPTTNITLYGENLTALPLRSETREECPHSSFLFNIVLEVLAIAIKEAKEKEIQIGNEEVKLSLFVDDIILCIENPR